jgi:hypothetical protein
MPLPAQRAGRRPRRAVRWARRSLVGALWIASACLVGCGAGSEASSAGTGAGGMGGGTGGGAVECDAGDVMLPDGVCSSAGVPQGACGDGFVSNERNGCDPILPPQPCPTGELAVPGDTDCAPLADCGQTPWGDVPVEAGSQYVDEAYAGGDSDGSASKPWTTIDEAMAAAAPGAIVAVTDGNYGPVVVTDSVALWGRCPQTVSVSGTPTSAAITVSGDGASVHQIAATGPSVGIVVADASDVELDRVWVHDTTLAAVDIYAAGSTTSMTRSLVEGGAEGVIISEGELVVSQSVIRRSAVPSGGPARGATVASLGSARSAMSLQGCVVEENVEVGVLSLSADLEIIGSVVRNNLPVPSSDAGIGIAAATLGGELASVSVVESVISGNRHAAMDLQGAAATLERVTIVDVGASDSGLRGFGVNANYADGPATVTVVDSLIERATNAGVIAFSSHVELDHVKIIDTIRPSALPDAATGGVLLVPSSAEIPTVTLRHTHILGGSLVGALALGGDLTIEHGFIADVMMSPDGRYGHAVHVQPSGGVPGRLWLRGSLLSNNHSHGVMISGGEATIESTWVMDTKSAFGQFGDGIAALAIGSAAFATIVDSTVARSERAGVVSFGSSVSLAGTRLDCNAIALATQIFADLPANIDDGGGNACGCGEASEACKALTTDLAVPTPLDPL